MYSARRATPTLGLVLLFLLVAASCGSSGSSEGASDPGSTAAAEPSGVRVVDVDQAALIHENPPDDLVVLDVRTPEEFAEGHLEGAVMIDFYSPDFADDIAELDRSVPYLLYCRSGNRSGQARALMEDLGFIDVADIDGGIVAWSGADLPLVGP